MEKMYDVFELPVSYSGEFIYEKDQECNWCCGSFDTESQARLVSHAINHVDSLADALERLTETKVINPQYLGQLGVDAINNAKAALVAYRGK